MASPIFLLTSCSFLLFTVVSAQEVDFCSTHKSVSCTQFTKDNGINCISYKNGFDCLKSVTANSASFAIVNPQQTLLGGQMLPRDIEVLAEARDANRPERSTDFDLVVIVKDANISSFRDLKGKQLCHPGFGKINGAKQLFNVIDTALLSSVECDVKEPSAIHRRIKAMEDFFGASCRLGPWVENNTMDVVLKSQHKNLCKLCNDSDCSSENVADPFAAALDCFDESGFVAITTAELAEKRPSVVYLCRNGTTSRRSCIWTSKSWPVVLTKKETVTEVRNVLTNNFAKSKLFPNTNEEIYFLQSPKNLQDYVSELNALPVKSKCPEVLKWCTTSDREMEECDTLKIALYTQGVLPEVHCLQKSDGLACLESIKVNECDIMAVSSKHGYTARSKVLRPIAFPAVSKEKATRSMIVTKTGSKKSGLSSLMTQFGCFSEFGDISLMSFFKELQESGVVKYSCGFGTMMDGFLGESCIPGINDGLNEESGIEDTMKYCKCQGSHTAKTAVTCSANSDNDYYGNPGALKCLKEVGQFAVITNKDIDDYLADDTFRVLCRNGSFAMNTGLLVDDDCYLSITSNSEIVIRRGDKKLKDAVLMLLDIERDVERNLGLFGSLQNLIFKDSSDPILFFDAGENVYVENYESVFKIYDACILRSFTTNGACSMGHSTAYILGFVFTYKVFWTLVM